MKRKKRGNMLLLTGALVSVNALGLLIASSFGSLYFVHNRLQTTADELALLGTSMLNQQDRIGQMNNMIAMSRQMVYDASSSNAQAQTNGSPLFEIANQLHNEAREGAQLLEQERQKLSAACKQDAQTAVTNQFNAVKQGHAFSLPWLQVKEPTLQIVSFGRITAPTAVQSNVSELTGIPNLDAADRVAQYITTGNNPLYKCGINANVTGADSDLAFKICSLPAPVLTSAQGAPAQTWSIPPARVVLASAYSASADDQISSAVQVKLVLNVSTGLGPAASSIIEATGTAETTGGQPVTTGTAQTTGGQPLTSSF